MTITIKLKTGNAAFEGDKDSEIRRILTEIADTWPVSSGMNVRDYNGNTVGSVTVTGK